MKNSRAKVSEVSDVAMSLVLKPFCVKKGLFD